MVAQETNVSNGAESTLSSSLSSGATTINVTDTSTFPSVPFYAVIDPDVDATREVVLVDGSKTGTTFVLSGASKRGQDGTTDTAHSAGAKVACVPVAALWTDINDRVDAVSDSYAPGGTDVAVADGGTGASTAAAARTNLGLVIGTDVQAYSAVLAATTASFTVADETKLDSIEAGATDDTAVNSHIADATDAHDASAVSIADAGGFYTGSDVEAALQEIGADLTSPASTSDRTLITGFGLVASLAITATRLYRTIPSSPGVSPQQIPVVMDRAGSVVGLSVSCSEARTSGSMTFEVYINGAATGFTATIDGTNTQYVSSTQVGGLDSFTAGDRLDVRATDAVLQPDSSNYIEASITVEFD